MYFHKLSHRAWKENFQTSGTFLVSDCLKLDDTVVDRITNQAAKEVLTVRERIVELLRSGKWVAGDQFRIKTVSVQIDGARTRIRSVLGKGTELNKRFFAF